MGNTDEKGYSPQVVSIFSGCGGLDLGFHLEGYETIWANDFAEWAVKSFEKNFGKVIHLKDITKINPYRRCAERKNKSYVWTYVRSG